MQQYKQLRFYNWYTNTHNSPAVSSEADMLNQWYNGVAFSSYLPAVLIGILAPPGTKFEVNGSGKLAIVGYTGLFELDLTNGGEIVTLSFDKDSLYYINSNPTASLIVDLVYEPGEG